MPIRISVFSVTVLLGAAGFPGLAASKDTECTHPTNKTTAQILRARIGLSEVHSYLSGKNIRHGIYDKNEQNVDISRIGKRGLHRLGKLSIVTAIKFDKKSRWTIISKGELLLIEFGNDQRMTRYTCKLYFTGP